jgi:hypothetical protein
LHSDQTMATNLPLVGDRGKQMTQLNRRVQVYVKRRLRLDLLNFEQRQMYEVGKYGLDQVLDRISSAINTNDAPSKPLRFKYAQQKSRRGLSNRRDLTYSGAMLGNLSVRTVSRNFVRVGMTSELQRKKARANERREPFAAFSPQDQESVFGFARLIMVREKLPRLVKQLPAKD